LCSLCVGYCTVCLVVQFVCGLLYSMSCCAVCVWVTVQYVLLLSHRFIAICFMSFALCYVLTNCFMFFNLLFYVCFLVLCAWFLFSVFCVLNCFLYNFSPCMKLYIFYLCTILPTTATGRQPICS